MIDEQLQDVVEVEQEGEEQDGGDMFSGMGVFAQPGMEPPLNAIWRQLRTIWIQQGTKAEGRNYSSFARMLGLVSQNSSQFASGSDGRRPPWHLVMYVCEVTGYELRGGARRWQLVRARKSGEQ